MLLGAGAIMAIWAICGYYCRSVYATVLDLLASVPLLPASLTNQDNKCKRLVRRLAIASLVEQQDKFLKQDPWAQCTMSVLLVGKALLLGRFLVVLALPSGRHREP
jgi:hypothetical protein